jgi:hypothetical protein
VRGELVSRGRPVPLPRRRGRHAARRWTSCAARARPWRWSGPPGRARPRSPRSCPGCTT